MFVRKHQFDAVLQRDRPVRIILVVNAVNSFYFDHVCLEHKFPRIANEECKAFYAISNGRLVVYFNGHQKGLF